MIWKRRRRRYINQRNLRLNIYHNKKLKVIQNLSLFACITFVCINCFGFRSCVQSVIQIMKIILTRIKVKINLHNGFSILNIQNVSFWQFEPKITCLLECLHGNVSDISVFFFTWKQVTIVT